MRRNLCEASSARANADGVEERIQSTQRLSAKKCPVVVLLQKAKNAVFATGCIATLDTMPNLCATQEDVARTVMKRSLNTHYGATNNLSNQWSS